MRGAVGALFAGGVVVPALSVFDDRERISQEKYGFRFHERIVGPTVAPRIGEPADVPDDIHFEGFASMFMGMLVVSFDVLPMFIVPMLIMIVSGMFVVACFVPFIAVVPCAFGMSMIVVVRFLVSSLVVVVIAILVVMLRMLIVFGLFRFARFELGVVVSRVGIVFLAEQGDADIGDGQYVVWLIGQYELGPVLGNRCRIDSCSLIASSQWWQQSRGG